MINFMRIALLLGAALCTEAVTVHALEVSSVIGDHMVLQRDTKVAIWGWDTAGIEVQVSFREQTASAKTGVDGKWLVRIPSGAAGGPFTMKIKGSGELVVNDILVGEVWIAGGQSNMWWPLSKCEDAQKEIAAAKHSRDTESDIGRSCTSQENLGETRIQRNIGRKCHAGYILILELVVFISLVYLFCVKLRSQSLP